MTPKEAKKRILNVHELGVDCDLLSKEQYEFHKVLLEALEKQIPKKPIDYHYPWAICPTCGGSVDCENVKGYILDKEHSHCEHCGQTIDWSDDND